MVVKPRTLVLLATLAFGMVLCFLTHSVIGCLGLMVLVVVWSLAEWGFGELGSYMMLFFGFEFVLRPALDAFVPGLFHYESANYGSYFFPVLSFELGAITVFSAGYAWGRKRAHSTGCECFSPPDLRVITVFVAIVMLARVGLILLGHVGQLNVTVSGFVGNVLIRFSNSSPVPLILSVASWINTRDRRALRLLLLILGVDLAWGYLIGSKLILFIDVAVGMLTWAAFGRSVKRLLILAGTLLLAYSGWTSIRQHLFPIAGFYKGQFGYSIWSVGVADLLARFDNFPTALRVFASGTSHTVLGVEMLQGIFQQAILPVPVPGKMSLNVGGVVAVDYWRLPPVAGVHIGLGLALSLLLSFGYLGCMSLMGLLGFLLSRGYQFTMDRLKKGSVGTMVLLGIEVGSILDVERSYFGIFDAFVRGLILWGIYLFIYVVLSGNKSRGIRSGDNPITTDSEPIGE